jgi:hypothetical protein
MLPKNEAPVPATASARVEPLSASRYRVELTVSIETKVKLERVRDLMLHRNPTGDLETIFEASLDLLLMKLERERLGKTTRSKVKRRSAMTDGDGEPGSAHRNSATDAERANARGGAERTGAASPVRAAASGAERAAASTEQNAQPCDSDSHQEAQDFAAHTQPDTVAAAASEAPTLVPTARSATNEPGAVKPASSKKPARRGHVSRAVRREVWARDGEQCTYVDAEGNRCPARGFLELDHVDAKALGGSDEAANLRLRCRVHNHLHAEHVFGRAYNAGRIHLRQRKSAASVEAPSFETAARGHRSLGFRESEVREVIARLATRLDTDAAVETIIKEALRLLT